MREVRSLREQAEQRFKDDFKRQAQDHQHELDGYIDRVHNLQGQLRTAEARSDALQNQLREKTLGPGAFTDFLEREPNVTVSANWKRLQELFAHFIAGTKPPAAWMTHIHVLAADEPRCVSPKPSSSSGSKTSPKRKPKTSHSKKGGSKRDVPSKETGPQTAQELFRRLDVRPTDYAPSDQLARSAQDPLQRTNAETRKSLPGAQGWKDLRLDVRYLMLAGQKYPRAMELVIGDNVLHQYFPPDALVRMLKCMILDGGLDCTPWARYVPETFYLRAEVQVQSAIEHGEEYDTWPLLAMDDVKDDSSSSEIPRMTLRTSQAMIVSKTKNVLRNPRLLQLHPRLRPIPASADAVPPIKRARTASNVPDRASTSGRKPTALALIPFKELTLEQLEVIENVNPQTTSLCRYFGIKIYFYGTKSKLQRYPFPNYAPQKGDMDFLAKRWSVDVYLTMFPTEDGVVIEEALPWVQRFHERVKILYFHDVDKLDAAILAGLSGYVFMGECCQAWWELLHWVTVKVDSNKDSFLFYQKRRSRTDTLLRRFVQEVKTLRAIPGFPETMFHEPGLWPLPTRKCNWIWENPRVVGVEGKPKPLSLQLVELDFREPARVLWSTLLTDAERIAHVPAEIRSTMLIPELKRSTNWIVPGCADNE
ncbi:unnamed protein product [Phytophthora fragariaefolia]|uniref:Unnamed protein product n=1 Tax=Phytophthora fragariaefolia TaxID=1490495 RepID=A0A9W6Y2W5_9STRA|nr:unnamed protein product [Phytophthora fragariaefolia]